MRGIITILARKGSKGLPNKSILSFNGLPLCKWTMNIAATFAHGKPDIDIVVATDDWRASEIARDMKLWTVTRNPKYANDKAGKVDAIRDVLFTAENELWIQSNEPHRRYYDFVIDLDITNPIRRLEDIEKSLQIFKEKQLETLFSVTKSKKLPDFNLFPVRNDIVLLWTKDLAFCRQDADKWNGLNSNIYIYNAEWLRNPENKFVVTDNSEIYLMPDCSFCDIDTKLDFEIAEFLHRKYILNGGK